MNQEFALRVQDHSESDVLQGPSSTILEVNLCSTAPGPYGKRYLGSRETQAGNGAVLIAFLGGWGVEAQAAGFMGCSNMSTFHQASSLQGVETVGFCL